MNWFQKWKAFFFPVAGWEKRFRRYKAGYNTWEVPGRPELPKVVPFPLAWIAHTMVPESDEEADEASRARGFDLLDVVCCDSGKEGPVGVGVLCLRCGVPLHPEAANMYSPWDPPACRRCRWLLPS